MARDQSEELSRAVERFSKAVEAFTRTVDRFARREQSAERMYRSWTRLVEQVLRERNDPTYRWPGLAPYLSARGLPEEEAVALALESVAEVRQELWSDREPEDSAPDEEDVAKWERIREARRRDEGYEPL